jgi:hypothetical protein
MTLNFIIIIQAIFQNNNTSTISSQIAKVLSTQQSLTSLSLVSGQTASSIGASSTNSPSLIDAIIMSVPIIDQSPRRQQEFLTELFKIILDQLNTCDLLNENTSNLSVSPHTALPNFYQFIDRLCDKLWEGVYRRDSKELLDTLLKYLNNLKRKPFSNQFTHESLINSINRVLLYQLSRPSRNLNEQVAMLDVLHRINKLKSLLFATTGACYIQPEFYGCLAYCLLQITYPTQKSSFTGEESSAEDNLKKNTNESKEMAADMAKIPSKTQWYINTMFNETILNSASSITDEKVRFV